MNLKQIRVMTAVLMVCTVLPLQSVVSASENPELYSTKAENKLKQIQSGISKAITESGLTKNLLTAENETIQLVNGSFENPVIKTTSAQLDASAVPGWHTTSPSNLIEIQRNFEGVTAVDGDQYAELNADSIAALYQDVETTPGKTIRWKVSHRGRDGVDTAVVRFGAPNTDLPLIATMQSGKVWTEYQGTYTIPEGQTITRFEFEAVSTADGDITRGNYLDNIVFSTPSILEVTDSVERPTIKKNETTQYHVNLKDTGGMDAGNVKLEIPLPAQIGYVPDSVTVDGVTTSDVTYNASSNTVTVHLDKVKVSTSSIVSVGIKGLSTTDSAVNIKTNVLYEDLGFTDKEYSANTSGASISVVSGEKPVISAADVSVKKGKSFDVLANVTASDTEDGDVTNKITVTANDVDTSKVGTYHVTYSVTDSDDNTTTKTITVTVTSNDAPVISASDKSVKKGVTFNPLDGVTASDTEDGDVTSKVTVTNNDVNTSKIGTYHVTYSVTDSDGNTTTKTVTVTVTSTDAPTIVATDKSLKKGATFNPLDGVSASDLEDGNVTSSIQVTANDVNTSQVGTYHVTYSATNSDGNTTTKTITVTVTSNDAPVISATDKTMKKGSTFSPLSGVSASDTEDGNLTSSVKITANDVDTSKVGTYHVTYSVTDSDGNTTTKTITVTVTSNDAPVISATDKTMKKGSTFSPLSGVSASDTEDGNLTSSVKITANDVDTSKVGTYHVTYSVTDSDGNTTTKTITVTVTSNDAPVITAKDQSVKKGKTFSPLSGVTASDTEDGNLTSSVKVTANDVDTSKVGTYHVTYSVTDSDGNTTTKTITVTVTSNDAPVIEASDIVQRIHNAYDVKKAVTASDTEDGDLTSKITVTANDVNTEKAGVYHVTYSVTDSDGNTTTKTIQVTILTNDAPVITTSDVYLKAGDTFNPLEGITASDLEDGDLTASIKVVSTNVNMKSEGLYTVVYSVTDSDDNTTTVTRHIYVRTNDKPEIHVSDQTFKAGFAFDPMAIVSASDLEDGDVTKDIKITSNDVNPDVAGTYAITYSVTDSDNNTTTKTITVTVLTNEKPVITAADRTVKAHLDFDPMTGVSANDLEDGDISDNIKIIANDVNIDVPGDYHITYSVLDSDGNTTEKTITITVLSNDKPVITGQDTSFKAGRAFDPMAGITANDTEDGDITANIEIISNDVNPDVAGVYHVTYSITDSDGNKTEQTYTVTVLTNEKPVIHASDITLAFGQAFDPMTGVTAEDLEDGDITGNIQVISNDVNPNVAGIYHVTYSVTDSDGNETHYTITVIVGAQPIVPVDPITPVAPVKPVTPAKPVTPIKPSTKPATPSVTPVQSVNQVAPAQSAPITQNGPTTVLPKTGDDTNTSTLLFGGLLAALGALFLRRKK